MRLSWRYHKVAPGETLALIARSYRTTPQAIAKANSLEADASLLPDSALIIPVTPWEARYFRGFAQLCEGHHSLQSPPWGHSAVE